MRSVASLAAQVHALTDSRSSHALAHPVSTSLKDKVRPFSLDPYPCPASTATDLFPSRRSLPALERVKVDLRKIFEKGQGQSRLLLNAGFDLALANLRILISQRMWPCRERPTSSRCRCSTLTQRRSVLLCCPLGRAVESFFFKRALTWLTFDLRRSCATQRCTPSFLPPRSLVFPLA